LTALLRNINAGNMKTISLYFPGSLLIVLALISCHNSKSPENAAVNEKDSMKESTDSAMTAHLVDPSNAYPQPVVTGPEEDSSRTLDSTSWFIANALQQNRDEIILANMATKNASDKDIKKIALHLKNEHTSLLRELQNMQTAVPVALRSKQDLSVAHHNIEILQKLSGAEFEKNWTDAMIEEHQHMIQQYESTLARKPSKRTRTYINDALPRLKALLQELQAHSSVIYKT
jgi:putative membrane protein